MKRRLNMVQPLDPKSIPKYVNQLTTPPIYKPAILRDPLTGRFMGHGYTITVSEFYQQLLPPGFAKTKVWGFGAMVNDPYTGQAFYYRCTPGPTFETIRGVPVYVNWMNGLIGSHLLPVDPTLNWANPNNMPTPKPPFIPFPSGYSLAQKPVPIVLHLHGGEIPSAFDGNPDGWFTADGRTGPAFITRNYVYPNVQQPTALWYHDHTMGITRLNIYAGLAGLYLIRDIRDPIASFLPRGENEIPLVIQDRSFNVDGSLYFTQVGENPNIHPYWTPTVFGNTIMVNGKVWPNLKVKPQQYRFRLLNGSNDRFYNIKLSNQQSFIQIGSDGGYLPHPVELTSLMLPPAVRADILIDFSKLTPGTKVIMTNDANTPFPGGTAPNPQTDGQIMQFTITNDTVIPPKKLPPVLNIIPTLTPNKTRTLVLFVIKENNKTVILLLNGQRWGSPVSELPRAGATEDWVIPNFTLDTHPIHLHLIQFLLVSRQKFRADDYRKDWLALNKDTPPGAPPYTTTPKELPVTPYLLGDPVAPPENERGWRDTINMNPGEVTTIRIRFTSQDGSPFPFDPSSGPGYVWHCHMLDHEDNEFMRPYKVKL